MAVSKKTETTSKKGTSQENGTLNQSEMKTSEIRDLIDFIAQSGLNEVNIETKELKLHVKREPDQKIFKSTPAPMALPAAPVAAIAAALPATARSEEHTSELQSQ